MFETAFAQLRFAYSLLLGRPFHKPSLERLLQAAIATRREFGYIGGDAQEFLSGPMLDEESLSDVQLRRLRTQLRRALTETTYYPQALAGMNLDPRHLTWEEWLTLPLTPKEPLREQPGAFVRHSQSVTWLLMTTGTTGTPMTITASTAEMSNAEILSAFGLMVQGEISENDVIQISTSSRALGPNSLTMGGLRRLGALVYQTGIIDPTQALAMLARRHELPDKQGKPVGLVTYPSYLGHLVEAGLRQGYTPADFDLRFIFTGGELFTAGVKRRAQALFGPVTYFEGYGISETWAVVGTMCEQEHWHFEPTRGLREVIDPISGHTAAPGAVGTLVLTPFAPYFESAVRLRYDTQDLVRQLAEAPTCSLRGQPATGHSLGKKALSVHHAGGWTTPRDILEAIEGIDELPLPARCGFWAEESGQSVVDNVTVEVVAPEQLRATIIQALESRGVPLGTLILVDSPRRLQRPLLFRGDLHESGMGEWVHGLS